MANDTRLYIIMAGLVMLALVAGGIYWWSRRRSRKPLPPVDILSPLIPLFSPGTGPLIPLSPPTPPKPTFADLVQKGAKKIVWVNPKDHSDQASVGIHYTRVGNTIAMQWIAGEGGLFFGIMVAPLTQGDTLAYIIINPSVQQPVQIRFTTTTVSPGSQGDEAAISLTSVKGTGSDSVYHIEVLDDYPAKLPHDVMPVSIYSQSSDTSTAGYLGRGPDDLMYTRYGGKPFPKNLFFVTLGHLG